MFIDRIFSDIVSSDSTNSWAWVCRMSGRKKNILHIQHLKLPSFFAHLDSRIKSTRRESSILFTFVNVPTALSRGIPRNLWNHSEPGRFILRKTGLRKRRSRTGNGINSLSRALESGKFINPLCTYCAAQIKCRRFREIPSTWSCFLSRLPLVTSPTCFASPSCRSSLRAIFHANSDGIRDRKWISHFLMPSPLQESSTIKVSQGCQWFIYRARALFASRSTGNHFPSKYITRELK